ncbi:MAG: hypothetical protein ACRDPY_34940 [Streptosporangiaceae bacterium]
MFYNVLGNAIEQGHLASRPTASSGQPPPSRRALTGASWSARPRLHLEAFYARLYYAALRPSEAVMLRARRTCTCRRMDSAGSSWPPPRPGRYGLDRPRHRPAGAGLKHRAVHETRTIPIPPDLVKLLRAHIQDSAYSAVWAEARKKALTPAQCRSPLGRRPYDLRHAAMWLLVPGNRARRRMQHAGQDGSCSYSHPQQRHGQAGRR